MGADKEDKMKIMKDHLRWLKHIYKEGYWFDIAFWVGMYALVIATVVVVYRVGF